VRIGLVAGETSGDLLGAGLIKALKERCPDATFEGVAGPMMQAAGCEVWEEAETLAVFGLIEPLKVIPKLLRLRRLLVRRWSENPPDVFVGIDAPDFNLGLEIKLREHGIRTVQYVSPSVWAWRQGRVRKVARAVDKVLCLLPFEKTFYDEHDVAADFVGHPMADNMPVDLDTATIRSELGIDAATVVAVLPGSRQSEVSRLGPVFASTCLALVKSRPDLRFVAPMVTDRLKQSFSNHLAAAGVRDYFLLTDGEAQSAIAASDLVLLASGTASLQTAMLCKPMVGAYRFSALTYAIAKTFKLINVPFFTLPNLLTAEPLVPEFLQAEVTPPALARAVTELLDDPQRRAMISRKFADLRGELALNADTRAAGAVLELAKNADC
jgi:lipid-A-disaccharide synthase